MLRLLLLISGSNFTRGQDRDRPVPLREHESSGVHRPRGTHRAARKQARVTADEEPCEDRVTGSGRECM